MKKDITIFIGSVGYPTFDRCYKTAKQIKDKDARVKDVVVIRDKFPTSAWLNEMRSLAKTTWALQVDEDMYLNDKAIPKLLDLAKRTEASGIAVLNASGMLYDLFLKTNIGSLKLWNTKVFKVAEFKDVKGSDRQFASDASKFGFKNVAINDVLGYHDSAPSKEIAYFKYKEYLSKIKKFEGEAAAIKFFKNFKNLCKSHNNEISRWALEGAAVGLKSNIDNMTKDYIKNMNSEELKQLRRKMG